MIRLSICIPTYNRGPFLRHLLDSIYSQFDERVEVVVSDNASTDDTQEQMEALVATRPRLRYVRSPENRGADANFLRVIELAEGEFCWLMGSDDQIEPGGIARVLRAIEETPDATGFTLNVVGHSFDMTNPYHPPIGMGQLDGKFFTGDCFYENGRDAFLRISDHFGYIGAQVVRRSVWDESIASIGVRIEHFKIGFIHVAVIAGMLKMRGRWGYIHQRCAGFRTGNDSFLALEGRYYRISMVVLSFSRILDEFWKDEPDVYVNVTRLILLIHVRNFIARWHLLVPLGKLGPFFMWKCFLLCTPHYWWIPSYWFSVVPFFFFPRPLTFAARSVFRRLKGRKLREAASVLQRG